MRLALLVATLTLATSTSATFFNFNNGCYGGYLYKTNKSSFCINRFHIGISWANPPQGTYCGSGFRFCNRIGSQTINRCIPTQPSYDDDNCYCGEGYKRDDGKCVPYTPPPTTPCDPARGFWWGGAPDCGQPPVCIPHTQPSAPVIPPNTDCCPDGWRWYKKNGKTICVPKTPWQPSCGGKPKCPKTHFWSKQAGCCKKNGGRKRSAAEIESGEVAFGAVDTDLCPSNLVSCPIKGVIGSYECLDTTQELESCGGCTSLGQGQDCTAISGAASVGCERGTCKIYTCLGGRSLSANGTACV